MRRRRENLTLRLCIAWSLPWTIPAVAVTFVATGIRTPLHDELFLTVFVGTSLLLAASFWLWWRLVAWTFGRILGSGAMSLALLAHALAWQPLWNAGCLADLLKLGQSEAAAGVWVVVTSYIWWGLAEGVFRWRKPTMTPNAVRLVSCVALVPLVPGLWTILVLAFENFIWNNDRAAFVVANLVCSLLVALWWWLAWRRAVVWTPRRARQTAGLAAGYVLLAGLAPLLPQNPGWVESLWVTLPLVLTGVWLVVAATIWQPGLPRSAALDEQVEQTLRCVSCGYSLVGLHEARCPECGRQSTLDELFMAVLAGRAEV